jgi:hypothetical protein
MGSTRPPLPAADRSIGASLTAGAGCTDGADCADGSSARLEWTTGRRATIAVQKRQKLFTL